MECHVPEGMLGTPKRMPSTSFYPLSVDLAYLCQSRNRMQAKGRWLAYFWRSCFFLKQRFNIKIFLGIKGKNETDGKNVACQVNAINI